MKGLLVLVLALSPLRAQEPATDDFDARVTEAKGEVTVYEAGGDSEGVPAEADMPLEAGDRVRTGADGSAELSMDGESVIQLRPNSDFTLTAPRRADSVFTLALGSLLAKIKHAAGVSVKVRTPTAVAAVRGTEFGVEVPEENPEETHVGVFDEGRVEVSGSDETGPKELLLSNQETTVLRGGRPQTPYQLKRLMRHRAFVRGMKRRVSFLRKNWKSLPPDLRREKRRQALGRMLQKRREILERRKLKPQPKPRRPQGEEGGREKMEQRRKQIRERLRRERKAP